MHQRKRRQLEPERQSWICNRRGSVASPGITKERSDDAIPTATQNGHGPSVIRCRAVFGVEILGGGTVVRQNQHAAQDIEGSGQEPHQTPQKDFRNVHNIELGAVPGLPVLSRDRVAAGTARNADTERPSSAAGWARMTHEYTRDSTAQPVG